MPIRFLTLFNEHGRLSVPKATGPQKLGSAVSVIKFDVFRCCGVWFFVNKQEKERRNVVL